MVESLLKDKYGLNVTKLRKATVGAGSDTYFATCGNEKYVIKFPCVSEMNNPVNEPVLCEYLLSKGIRVCDFIRNSENKFVSTDENGHIFHVQKFIDGNMFDWNTAPKWLLKSSAELLGKIHTTLTDFKGLPVGIGEAFFQNMTPKTAMQSYENTLHLAEQNGDVQIENDLKYRIELMKRFPEFSIDVNNLTCKNTHGDYFISQLICGDKEINAVIDWTTACRHPVVWEIVRSFVYASPNCKNGEITSSELIEYITDYLSCAELTNNDIAYMVKVFYYQIAVCDYYNQYYQSKADNREIYLRQAVFSTKLLKWFDRNEESLTGTLLSHFKK